MIQIQAIRTRKLITQRRLAEMLGVSQGAVAQWESGETQPVADKLPLIASALGCTIDELFQSPTERK